MPLFTASSKDQVLAMINGANPSLPVPVSEANLYFGVPRQDTDGVTSIAPTTAMLGQPYEGYATFRYKRINLSTAYDDNKPILTSVGASTLYGMLNLVNEFLGTNFTEDDLQDVDVARLDPGDQANIALVASPGSLGYYGSATIQYSRLYPTFASVLPNVSLDVLKNLIDPTLGDFSLSATMWGWDFSADIAALAVSSNGEWASLSELQTLVGLYGFTGWPAPSAGTVQDLPTSSVPTANAAFDRVVIQKSVSVGSYLGDAYFHYNL